MPDITAEMHVRGILLAVDTFYKALLSTLSDEEFGLIYHEVEHTTIDRFWAAIREEDLRRQDRVESGP